MRGLRNPLPVPLVLLSLIASLTTASELRINKLLVPERVEANRPVTLQCHFETPASERLRAVKWYKDGQEFYRFTASAHAVDQRQEFPIDGVTVDLRLSNERAVTLRHVGKATAGAYRCQVSVESSFRSVSDERRLQVVEFGASSGFARSNPRRGGVKVEASPVGFNFGRGSAATGFPAPRAVADSNRAPTAPTPSSRGALIGVAVAALAAFAGNILCLFVEHVYI